MNDTTRDWLVALSEVANSARKLIADGASPEFVLAQLAHEACEAPEDPVEVCNDLKLKIYVPAGPSGSVRFAAEAELFTFARGCLVEMTA